MSNLTDQYHARWTFGLWLVIVAIAAFPLAWLMTRLLGVPQEWRLLVSVPIDAMTVAVVLGVFHGARHAVVATLMRFLNPGNEAGPRPIAFSHAQAMAVRGDIETATAEFEALLKRGPLDTALHRAAAEFFAKEGRDPAKAVAVLHRLRQLPGAKLADEHYATHRLIDLYAGPLANTGRMRVELRRLIDRFPGTPDAAGAQVALERLRDESGM